MAITKEAMTRYSKDKILRIMGIQTLASVFANLKKKHQVLFMGELKRIHEGSKYSSDMEKAKADTQNEKRELERKISI